MAATATERALASSSARQVARQVHDVAAPAPADPGYAGLVTRLIAFALDAAVINGVAVLVAAALALVFTILPAPRDEVAAVVGGAAFAVWATGYFVAFWTTTGQTPGDRLLHIAVTDVDGRPLRPGHAVVRLVGMVLSAPLLLGFLPILVTARRRGLHDWMARTVVVTVDADRGRPR